LGEYITKRDRDDLPQVYHVAGRVNLVIAMHPGGGSLRSAFLVAGN